MYACHRNSKKLFIPHCADQWTGVKAGRKLVAAIPPFFLHCTAWIGAVG